MICEISKTSGSGASLADYHDKAMASQNAANAVNAAEKAGVTGEKLAELQAIATGAATGKTAAWEAYLAAGKPNGEYADYLTSKGGVAGENLGGVNSGHSGKLAAELGLGAEYRKEAFINIADGKSPDGKEQWIEKNKGNNADGSEKRKVSGIEAVFSVPKGVNLFIESAELTGNKELHENLMDACKKGIAAGTAHLEQFVSARIYNAVKSKDAGKDVYDVERTGNAVVTSFLHTASRNNDKLIHSHANFANMTKCADGTIRAIESKELFNHKIEAGMVAGCAARAALDAVAAKHGFAFDYEIRPDGTWDLKGLDKATLEHFSKGHARVVKQVAEWDKEGVHADKSKAAKQHLAAGMNKPDKNIPTAAAYRELREAGYKELGYGGYKEGCTTIIDNVKTAGAKREDRLTVSEAVDLAAKGMTEKESTFTTGQLIKTAVSFGGSATYAEYVKAVEERISNKMLVSMHATDKKGEELFSTSSLVYKEKQIMDTWRSGQGAAEAIMTPKEASAHISNFEKGMNGSVFTPSQRETLQNMLTTTDRSHVIQGDAGVGKSTAIKCFAAACAVKGIKVIGVQRGGKGAAEMKEDISSGKTTAAFLIDGKAVAAVKPGDNVAIVIDEAGVIGTSEMAKIHKIEANMRGFGATVRDFLPGDRAQLQPLEGASIVASGVDNGALNKGSHMHHVIRQAEGTAQRAVVDALVDRAHSVEERMSKALDILENQNNFIEIKNPAERTAAIADDYLKNGNAGKLIMADTHQRNAEITAAVRERMEAAGILTGPEITLAAYIPANLGNNKYHADNWKEHTKIIAVDKTAQHLSEDGKSSAAKGAYIVESRDLSKQTISARSEADGKLYKLDTINNAGKFAHYDPKPINVRVGDALTYRKTDGAFSVHNGTTGNITGIKDGKITVQLGNGKTITHTDKEVWAVQHGYCATVDSSQGDTRERATIHEAGPHTNFNKIYVGESRSKTEGRIYTADKAQTRRQAANMEIKKSTADYLKSAIERGVITPKEAAACAAEAKAVLAERDLAPASMGREQAQERTAEKTAKLADAAQSIAAKGVVGRFADGVKTGFKETFKDASLSYSYNNLLGDLLGGGRTTTNLYLMNDKLKSTKVHYSNGLDGHSRLNKSTVKYRDGSTVQTGRALFGSYSVQKTDANGKATNYSYRQREHLMGRGFTRTYRGHPSGMTKLSKQDYGWGAGKTTMTFKNGSTMTIKKGLFGWEEKVTHGKTAGRHMSEGYDKALTVACVAANHGIIKAVTYIWNGDIPRDKQPDRTNGHDQGRGHKTLVAHTDKQANGHAWQVASANISLAQTVKAQERTYVNKIDHVAGTSQTIHQQPAVDKKTLPEQATTEFLTVAKNEGLTIKKSGQEHERQAGKMEGKTKIQDTGKDRNHEHELTL